MMKKNNKLNKGFTLVETLVAISIFTMSILGLMSILASSISDINYAKQKIAASYLAQEGIEYVRNLRDTAIISSVDGTGWTTFKALLPPSSDSSFYPPDGSTFPNFTRTISVDTTFGPDEIKITSDVSWTQGSGDKHIIFSENLYNWTEE
ncbi:MAG: prepilin-type N-terminal cleavage/methylation domain-containing protein [Candidatus Paceibacterota bacterium]